MKQIVPMTINSEPYELAVEPYHTLLDALRNEAGLTGAKKGCDVGDCGACTVIIEARGSQILTIEGLTGDNGTLHPLQENFLKYGAAQCGFCTPGIIMAAKALLEENPRPTEAEVRFGLAGNICRCTGYAKIVTAILATANQGG